MAVVREIWGPYTDPSHPYHFDDDDMWMAPGFINEFHPVTPLCRRPSRKRESVVLMTFGVLGLGFRSRRFGRGM